MISLWAGVGAALRAMAAVIPVAPAIAYLVGLAALCLALLLLANRWEKENAAPKASRWRHAFLRLLRGWTHAFLALLFLFTTVIGGSLVFSEVVKGTDPGPGVVHDGPCNWTSQEVAPFVTPTLDLHQDIRQGPHGA